MSVFSITLTSLIGSRLIKPFVFCFSILPELLVVFMCLFFCMNWCLFNQVYICSIKFTIEYSYASIGVSDGLDFLIAGYQKLQSIRIWNSDITISNFVPQSNYSTELYQDWSFWWIDFLIAGYQKLQSIRIWNSDITISNFVPQSNHSIELY